MLYDLYLNYYNYDYTIIIIIEKKIEFAFSMLLWVKSQLLEIEITPKCRSPGDKYNNI